MSASKTRKVSQLLRDRYGIEDNQLAYEIVQAVMTPEPSGPFVDKWQHPAVLLAKSITGARVPSAMVDDIIAALGQNPDEKRARDCHRRMVKGGYEGAWYWLDDYAGTSKSKSASPQPNTPTAVYEWRE